MLIIAPQWKQWDTIDSIVNDTWVTFCFALYIKASLNM